MRRILFVDDRPEVLNAHREFLQKYRGQVETIFALGDEAPLQVTRNAPLDVVVADMHMPVMNGLALLGIIENAMAG